MGRPLSRVRFLDVFALSGRISLKAVSKHDCIVQKTRPPPLAWRRSHAKRERRDGGDFLPLPIADTYPALTVGEGEEEEAYYADN